MQHRQRPECDVIWAAFRRSIHSGIASPFTIADHLYQHRNRLKIAACRSLDVGSWKESMSETCLQDF